MADENALENCNGSWSRHVVNNYFNSHKNLSKWKIFGITQSTSKMR